MSSIVVLNILLRLFCCSLLFFAIGCTYDISNREPYWTVVGRSLCLKQPMKLWLPEKSNVKLSSYPYVLVDSWFSDEAHHANGMKFHDGNIVSLIPVGTPLRIDKVINHKALDDVHTDALGTIYIPSLHKEVNFDYTYSEFSLIPWGFNPKTNHQ